MEADHIIFEITCITYYLSMPNQWLEIRKKGNNKWSDKRPNSGRLEHGNMSTNFNPFFHCIHDLRYNMHITRHTTSRLKF